jgi:hypothetical protein
VPERQQRWRCEEARRTMLRRVARPAQLSELELERRALLTFILDYCGGEGVLEPLALQTLDPIALAQLDTQRLLRALAERAAVSGVSRPPLTAADLRAMMTCQHEVGSMVDHTAVGGGTCTNTATEPAGTGNAGMGAVIALGELPSGDVGAAAYECALWLGSHSQPALLVRGADEESGADQLRGGAPEEATAAAAAAAAAAVRERALHEVRRAAGLGVRAAGRLQAMLSHADAAAAAAATDPHPTPFPPRDALFYRLHHLCTPAALAHALHGGGGSGDSLAPISPQELWPWIARQLRTLALGVAQLLQQPATMQMPVRSDPAVGGEGAPADQAGHERRWCAALEALLRAARRWLECTAGAESMSLPPLLGEASDDGGDGGSADHDNQGDDAEVELLFRVGCLVEVSVSKAAAQPVGLGRLLPWPAWWRRLNGGGMIY